MIGALVVGQLVTPSRQRILRLARTDPGPVTSPQHSTSSHSPPKLGWLAAFPALLHQPVTGAVESGAPPRGDIGAHGLPVLASRHEHGPPTPSVWAAMNFEARPTPPGGATLIQRRPSMDLSDLATRCQSSMASTCPAVRGGLGTCGSGLSCLQRNHGPTCCRRRFRVFDCASPGWGRPRTCSTCIPRTGPGHLWPCRKPRSCRRNCRTSLFHRRLPRRRHG